MPTSLPPVSLMPTEPSFWNVMKRGSGLRHVKITVILKAEINYEYMQWIQYLRGRESEVISSSLQLILQLFIYFLSQAILLIHFYTIMNCL